MLWLNTSALTSARGGLDQDLRFIAMHDVLCIRCCLALLSLGSTMKVSAAQCHVDEPSCDDDAEDGNLPAKALRATGLTSFKQFQEEAISAAFHGEDILVIAATGALSCP